MNNKYFNKKTTVHGITFQSKAEADRYLDLVMLQNAGAITNLEMQVPFELVPKQRKSNGKLERPCDYRADFVYYENGHKIVEDVKGFRTTEYVMKRKLMLFLHGIEIRETGK